MHPVPLIGEIFIIDVLQKSIVGQAFSLTPFEI
jgi:hypothetical protein